MWPWEASAPFARSSGGIHLRQLSRCCGGRAGGQSRSGRGSAPRAGTAPLLPGPATGGWSSVLGGEQGVGQTNKGTIVGGGFGWKTQKLQTCQSCRGCDGSFQNKDANLHSGNCPATGRRNQGANEQLQRSLTSLRLSWTPFSSELQTATSRRQTVNSAVTAALGACLYPGKWSELDGKTRPDPQGLMLRHKGGTKQPLEELYQRSLWDTAGAWTTDCCCFSPVPKHPRGSMGGPCYHQPLPSVPLPPAEPRECRSPLVMSEPTSTFPAGPLGAETGWQDAGLSADSGSP